MKTAIPLLVMFGLGLLLGWIFFSEQEVVVVKNAPPTELADALMDWADDGGQGNHA